MRLYPEYKDSDVAWLGEVPAHWEVKRLKHILARNDGGAWGEEGNSDDTPVLRSTEINLDGTWNSSEPARRKLTQRELDATRLTSGDLVVTKSSGSSAHIGKTALVTEEVEAMGASFSNFMQRLRLDTAHDPVIYFHFLNNQIGREQLDYLSSTTTGLKNLNAAILGDVIVPSAPPPEQTAIAAYLDRKTAQIDAVIARKERLLKLLQEMREAVTQEAMNSSSSQSARLGVVANRITLPVHRQDHMSYTPIGLFNRGRGIFHKEPTGGSELGDSDFFWVEEGDLVISGQFAWEGAVALAQQSDNGCIASHRYHILRGMPGILETPYLISFFKTQYGDLLLSDHSRGAAGRNRPLNIGTLLKEKIPVPPLAVQRNIAELVHKETLLKQETEKRVSLLHEYRNALISAVVTGKVDVREEVAL